MVLAEIYQLPTDTLYHLKIKDIINGDVAWDGVLDGKKTTQE